VLVTSESDIILSACAQLANVLVDSQVALYSPLCLIEADVLLNVLVLYVDVSVKERQPQILTSTFSVSASHHSHQNRVGFIALTWLGPPFFALVSPPLCFGAQVSGYG
jgi:hypothetical protein